MINVGVVGCGRVARHYLELNNLGLTPELNYLGWFDINSKKSNAFKRKYGGISFPSLKSLLKESTIDAVFVLTPSGNHFQTALEVIKNKKNILIEKPICLRLNEINILEKEARLNKIVLSTILQNRYNQSIIKFQEMKSKGKIGKIISGGLKLRWGRDKAYYNDGWHGTWKLDGGVVAQQAIHHIFAIDSLIGPIKSIYARRSNQTHDIECEDTCNGIFELQDSTYITFELTTGSPNGDFEASISLLTEKGVFEINGRALNNLEYKKNLNSETKKIINEEVFSGYGYGHIEELKKFTKLIKTNNNGFINISDGRRAVKLVHAVYSSIEKNKWINLDSKFESKKLGV